MARYRSRDRHGVNLPELIEEIKKFPFIYDFTMEEHCQKICMDSAWTEISKRMGYPAILCKERWRKIRTAFSRSLKQNAMSINKKPYYLYKQLKFLLPHMKMRYVIEPEINNGINDYNSDSSGEGRLQIVEDIPENENNNVSNNVIGTDESANNGKEPIVESETETDESRKMFLLSLLSDVSQLTDFEMTMFKKKTLNVIEELIALRRNV